MPCVMLKSDKGVREWHPATQSAAFQMVEAFVFGVTGQKITVTKENEAGSFCGVEWAIITPISRQG